ncbi:F-box domain protein [Saltwater crocodilepox virus]|nr:F-box domain protein [Saltwater crocodilepox virus]QGT48362.1 ORF211 [Saltwater crocodilepox virus]QGT48578.1 ORF211 [Saltwater crocodilepox virus]QGT48792.1 ORF211 [Saltwater crocodilepox virus]QGT49004.1 ORF211 [Saltwater crocodilepox virus]
MDHLPVELLHQVFSYLTDRDVCACGDVCRRWCDALRSRYFWTRRVRSVSRENWISFSSPPSEATARALPVSQRISICIEAPENRLDVCPVVIRSNPLVYSSDRSAVIIERGRPTYFFSACIKPRLGAPNHLSWNLDDLISKVVQREYSGEAGRICRISLLRRNGNCVLRVEVSGSLRHDHRLVIVSTTPGNRKMYRSSAVFSTSVIVGLGLPLDQNESEHKVEAGSLCHYINFSIGGSDWLAPFRFRVIVLSDAKAWNADSSH